jgi:hypothetical protein
MGLALADCWDRKRDWDEILATTEDDFEAGRFAFNSEDYPTHEEAMKALDQWMQNIFDEVQRDRDVRRTAISPYDAAGF